MPEDFDFDAWADLARGDSVAFEEVRRIRVEQLIAAGRNPERLRHLQWRVEAERYRAKTPLKTCLVLTGLMWDSFADLRMALDGFMALPSNSRRHRLVLIGADTEETRLHRDGSASSCLAANAVRILPFMR